MLHSRVVRGDDGLSLIEVIVALFVFALFASGGAMALARGLDLTRTSHDRMLATSLAAQEVDRVRDTVSDPSQTAAQAAAAINGLLGQATSTSTVDKVAFTTVREVAWVNQDSSSGPCDGGTASTHSARAYLRIDVKVTWAKMTGAHPIHSDTLVYPKVGAFDPVTGAAAIKVVGASGQAVGGVPVSLSGPSNLSETTASDGCAFFAYIPAGAYTATATLSGYVDLNGNASATNTSVGVTVGAVTSTSLSYDAAATVSATPTPRDASHPVPAGLPIRLANTQLTAGVTGAYCSAATAYPCAASGLFPFSSGDDVWVGDCSDARPGTPTKAALTAGQTTTSGTTKLVALDITVAGTTASPVYLSHVAETPSTGCTAVRRYLIGTSTGGTTNVLKVSIPLGTWTLSRSSTVAPTTIAPAVRPSAYDVVTASDSTTALTATIL